MRVAQNAQDDRAGLRGYVQFNKYTHTYTHTHTSPGVFARRHDGGPPVEGNLRREPGVA